MWLYSEIKSLADIPRHYARLSPEKPALIDAAGPTTFAELDLRSNRVANVLVEFGLQRDARVAFLGKNDRRYFEVLFGAAKAGAALVPLNWRLAVPELSAIMRDASPAVIVFDREYADTARVIAASGTAHCRAIGYNSNRAAASEFDDLRDAATATDPAITVDPWQTAVLMYTSGTTGKPKGVQLPHQGYLFLRLCEHLEPSFGYASGDIMLTVLPLFHAMGSGLALQALYNGAAVAVYPMPEMAELIELIARDRPTVLPLVPTVMQMLLDHPNSAFADYSSVRVVVYAGSSISAHLLKRALQEMKCQFIQFYGSTETIAGVTYLRPEQHQLHDEAKLKSCGSPLPLVDIKVADPAGNALPDGQVGEFLIRSPSLTTGYFNQPAATAAAFRDGWYRSGDAGYRDRDGLFYLVDRVKDMIITGGENVYSVEVEEALQKLPAIRSCAVVALPDEKWGERVVAAIVLAPAASLTTDQAIAHCRSLIAGYKVPKQVEFVHSLPMTASGKVMKQALREQLLMKFPVRSL